MGMIAMLTVHTMTADPRRLSSHTPACIPQHLLVQFISCVAMLDLDPPAHVACSDNKRTASPSHDDRPSKHHRCDGCTTCLMAPIEQARYTGDRCDMPSMWYTTRLRSSLPLVPMIEPCDVVHPNRFTITTPCATVDRHYASAPASHAVSCDTTAQAGSDQHNNVPVAHDANANTVDPDSSDTDDSMPALETPRERSPRYLTRLVHIGAHMRAMRAARVALVAPDVHAMGATLIGTPQTDIDSSDTDDSMPALEPPPCRTMSLQPCDRPYVTPSTVNLYYDFWCCDCWSPRTRWQCCECESWVCSDCVVACERCEARFCPQHGYRPFMHDCPIREG